MSMSPRAREAHGVVCMKLGMDDDGDGNYGGPGMWVGEDEEGESGSVVGGLGDEIWEKNSRGREKEKS